jgi:hypothetical protein
MYILNTKGTLPILLSMILSYSSAYAYTIDTTPVGTGGGAVSSTWNRGASSSSYVDYVVGQSFYINSTSTLTDLNIFARSYSYLNGYTGVGSIYIAPQSSTVEGMLANSLWSSSLPSSGNSIQQLSFSPQLTLQAGTYSFFFQAGQVAYPSSVGQVNNMFGLATAQTSSGDLYVEGSVWNSRIMQSFTSDPNIQPIVTSSYENLNFSTTGDLAFQMNLAPVPEPETYAMLLAGLGLIGGIKRRRMQKAATA